MNRSGTCQSSQSLQEFWRIALRVILILPRALAGKRSAGIKPTVFDIKKARLHFCNRALLLLKNPAIPTFALVGTIIGSESLTTVFGMGTGGPFGYGHRERTTGAVAHCDPVDHDTFWIGKCYTLCSTIQYRPGISVT